MMTKKEDSHYSIIIPAKDEAQSLGTLLTRIRDINLKAEVIVVNDGSRDKTAEIALESGARVINHPYSMGNGAAIKSGARVAKGDILIFMDADGQHDIEDIPRLLNKLEEGYDMVVGARTTGSQAGFGRLCANTLYNWLASRIVGHKVEDLTSGFRAVRADRFREFLPMYPNGFSYPTTCTMAFFRAGYPIAYLPIIAARRQGKSHIRPLKDGLRFLLIIFRVGTLYSPLKLFVPMSFAFFASGMVYSLYTLLHYGRFTNMSALLFSTAIIIFLIGLVSEQITSLLYIQGREDKA